LVEGPEHDHARGIACREDYHRAARRVVAEALVVHLIFVLVVVFFLVPFVWLFTAAF